LALWPSGTPIGTGNFIRRNQDADGAIITFNTLNKAILGQADHHLVGGWR